MKNINNKRWLITLVMSFVMAMCTFIGANAAMKWTSVDNKEYVLEIVSDKIITYKNYLYTIGTNAAKRIEIAKISDDGRITDVTPPNKKPYEDIYFDTDVVATGSRTFALIQDDKLFVLLERTGGNGCYIKEYRLDNPEIPEFVCNYVPTLGETTSTYGAFNMAYVDGGIEFYDMNKGKYRFTKEGKYDSDTKSYEAVSVGTFAKNPYYTYSFTHNGANHTFYTNKNKIYYMDHAHETFGCDDWGNEIYSNAKAIAYNDGYLYIISLDNVLSSYAFDFSNTSSNRTALKNRLEGEPDSTVSLDGFTAMENEITPLFENGIMYIAENDAIAAIDVRNPSNLAISAVIPCKNNHDLRTMGVYNNVLLTKVCDRNESKTEVFLVSMEPEVNAVYEGNSVNVTINDMPANDTFLLVLAVYGSVNGVDKLNDFDCKEITKDGKYTLTADPGERVVTFVWRKDLTPIAKYIK